MRASLLVSAFKRLRRKLPYHLGWCRVIETATSAESPNLENCHLHFVMLFPPGVVEPVSAIAWDDLWKACAGEFARDTDPNAGIANEPGDVARYMTKSMDWDFFEDAAIGIADPQRYIHRIRHGHTKFSGGGSLRIKVFSEADKECGLDVLPRSTARDSARRPRHMPIPIEGA
jgi:hypothetical protein